MRISDWIQTCALPISARGWQPRGYSDVPREGRQGQEGGALHDRREGGAIGMEVSTELDRNTLVALLDRMIRAEALGDAPPQAERGDWMFGSVDRSEEHTSELQSLMRILYAVFFLTKKILNSIRS